VKGPDLVGVPLTTISGELAGLSGQFMARSDPAFGSVFICGLVVAVPPLRLLHPTKLRRLGDPPNTRC
jgi:hypothetical protein